MGKRLAVFCFAVYILFLPFFTQIRVFADASNNTAASPYGEHIRLITDISSFPMQIEVFNQETGQYCSKYVSGSDYIPVGSSDYIQFICEPLPGSADLNGGEFYIYFYDQNKTLIWDILDYIDAATGERNRIRTDYLKGFNGFQFSNIPDGSFIRIAKANNHPCHLLIWDGSETGYPLSSLPYAFNTDCKTERLPTDGSACIQVPKTAVYLIAKPGYTFIDMMTSTTSVRDRLSYSTCRFPSQVVYLRGFLGAGRAKNIRVVTDYDYKTKEYSPVMPDVDLSDAIVAVDENSITTTGLSNLSSNRVLQNIEACLDYTWEAKADIPDNWGYDGKDGIVGTFHKGVTYHGIPYRSSWNTASAVGWHVSKQTFMATPHNSP